MRLAHEHAGLRDIDEAAAATSAYLLRGEELLGRLPARLDRSETEERAAAELRSALDAERARFLREHSEAVYDALTDGLRRAVRDEDPRLRGGRALPRPGAHARRRGR